MIGEDAHDLGVLIEPRVPRIRRQQHFFFFAKMQRSPVLCQNSDKFSACRSTAAARFSAGASAARRISSA